MENKSFTAEEALDRLYYTTYTSSINRKEAYIKLKGLLEDYKVLKEFTENTLNLEKKDEEK